MDNDCLLRNDFWKTVRSFAIAEELLVEPYWLIDSSSMEESVMFWMSEKEFRATLTPKQLDIYLNCIIGGQSKIDYAAANNMQRQSVYNAATLIMKKAKYFFKKF